MVDRLFAYGTLLAPELLRSVVGRALEGQPAVLAGYVCYRVRRAAYPAIARQAQGLTHGSVFSGISLGEWQCLDDFESSMYERCLVEVTLADKSNTVVYTYVITEPNRSRLTCEPWEFEKFRQLHLKRYLGRMPD
jgi:gamma-glutamylcyclotransferase (GGCT)/AIG2-like uncharacterized protein YtfP